MSSDQLSRMLGVTYESESFMSHGVREAMTDTNPASIGGQSKVIEAGEVYHGKCETPVVCQHLQGRPCFKRKLAKQKRWVLALVERGGQIGAKHVNFADEHAVRAIL